MLTFTQRKEQAAKLCGIHYKEPEMAVIISNLNNADKLFENAARRSWTRKEYTEDIVADQQFYVMPADAHRVSTVKCRIASDSDIIVPLTEVQSEDDWNTINSFPFKTNYPTHFFIRGYNEIGLYPCPSEDVTDGMMVSYEPRIRDMGIDDKQFKVDVTNGSTTITNASSGGLDGGFKQYMTNGFWIKSDDGEDGNWYRIVDVDTDNDTATLSTAYMGPTKAGADVTMGQVPPYPEEYHEAAVFYACFKFFAMRKDTDSSAMYRTLFDDALNQYRETYGSKTTSGVINPGRYTVPNITDVFKNGTLTEGV
jgi:hypothetical protein